jgi:anti-sigma factor ChrR (cupin superfamily)
MDDPVHRPPEDLLLAALAKAGPASPQPDLRQHVLAMADVPQGPIDVTRYEWDEVAPGIRVHVVRDEPERGYRAVLVWAEPGARMATHRHLGDEDILVLEGRLRDYRGEYGPGELCRSRTGSVHAEEAGLDGRCICFVAYYGGHEPVEE